MKHAFFSQPVDYSQVLVRCPWRMAVLQEEGRGRGDLTVVPGSSFLFLQTSIGEPVKRRWYINGIIYWVESLFQNILGP